MQVKVLECPNCGAPVELSDKRCEYCNSRIFVNKFSELEQLDPDQITRYIEQYETFNQENPQNTEGPLSLGLCYLSIGSYSLAQKCFKQVLKASPSPPVYYFCALSTIGGRRLMTLSLSEVRRLEEYLNTARQFDTETPQYRLLLAMLKRDYYETNGLKVRPPNATELLSGLVGETIDEDEVDYLRRCVRVSNLEDYFKGLSIV